MTLPWLATVMVPSTALAWNLLRDTRPRAEVVQPELPAWSKRAGPIGEFEAGGRVYRAVEAALQAGRHRA